MINKAINIETVYPGLTFCEKIKKVAEQGFNQIEFWGWDALDLDEVKKTCDEAGVKVRAFSATKEWSLCDVEHRTEYIDWIEKSIEAAKKLDCNSLILFPNHFTPNGCADFREKYTKDAMFANITATLTMLVPTLEKMILHCFLSRL